MPWSCSPLWPGPPIAHHRHGQAHAGPCASGDLLPRLVLRAQRRVPYAARGTGVQRLLRRPRQCAHLPELLLVRCRTRRRPGSGGAVARCCPLARPPHRRVARRLSLTSTCSASPLSGAPSGPDRDAPAMPPDPPWRLGVVRDRPHGICASPRTTHRMSARGDDNTAIRLALVPDLGAARRSHPCAPPGVSARRTDRHSRPGERGGNTRPPRSPVLSDDRPGNGQASRQNILEAPHQSPFTPPVLRFQDLLTSELACQPPPCRSPRWPVSAATPVPTGRRRTLR